MKTSLLLITLVTSINAHAATGALKISIDDLGSTTIAANQNEAVFSAKNQTLKYPLSYGAETNETISQITDYAEIETGWKISIKTKKEGDKVVIKGYAEYTNFEGFTEAVGHAPKVLVDGKAYGFYQPCSSVTTTRFIAYAKPGESYKISLREGTKVISKKLTVTTQ